jgi:putative addiction module component (TIGR02574 family)
VLAGQVRETVEIPQTPASAFDSCAFPFVCGSVACLLSVFEGRAILGLVTREASEILDAALALPRAARAELAAILADSVGDGASPEQIQAAWLAEAKRRLEAYERGELEAVDYEDMMRRLQAKDRRPRSRQASVG